MHIHEAIKKALEQKCFITRKYDGRYTHYFEPTNGASNIIIHRIDDSKEPGPNWNPCADDLMSDQWELYIKE